MNKLNTIQFTVQTEDQVFKNKLLAFIGTQELVRSSSDDYTYKLNLVDDFFTMFSSGGVTNYKDAVANDGNDFFNLHIDNNNYSFSFENIAELYEFPEVEGVKGGIKGLYLAYNFIFSDQNLIQKRQKIIKNFMDFIRVEGLLESSVINSLSFVSEIGSRRYANVFKQQIKGEVPITTEDQQKDMYTGSVDYYKAYIKHPQEIIDIHRIDKGEVKVNVNDIGEDKVLKMLKESVKEAFYHIRKLHIKKDTRGYYIHADESCLKVWNKPVEISTDIFVEFKPVLIDLRNFYGIYAPIRQERTAKIYNSEMVVSNEVYYGLENAERARTVFVGHEERCYQKVHEVKMISKDRYAFILEMNDWKITDEKVLQSHNQNTYTLGDDIEDLIKHIDKIPKFSNITPKISSCDTREALKSLLS
jgi:hypothetical protein